LTSGRRFCRFRPGVFVYYTRVELDTYTFVLLRRGPRAHEFSDEELEEIQAGHLAFLDRMRAEGHLLLAGPFRDQDDETKRGLCVYRTGLEETRRLTEGDPRSRSAACGWRR
jgi:uncharacterized protein YciI